MTAAIDQFLHRGQEAFTTAARAWDPATRTIAGNAALPTALLPGLPSIIDAAFDFAARLLADQRAFSHALVSVGTRAFEAAAREAKQGDEPVATAPIRPPPSESAREKAPATASVAAAEPAPVVTAPPATKQTPAKQAAPAKATPARATPTKQAAPAAKKAAPAKVAPAKVAPAKRTAPAKQAPAARNGTGA